VELTVELPLYEARYCWCAKDGVEGAESKRRVFIVVGIKIQFVLRWRGGELKGWRQCA
jgi:hypothetical protein